MQKELKRLCFLVIFFSFFRLSSASNLSLSLSVYPSLSIAKHLNRTECDEKIQFRGKPANQTNKQVDNMVKGVKANST